MCRIVEEFPHNNQPQTDIVNKSWKHVRRQPIHCGCDAGCEDEYIIELANEVRKLLGVYEDGGKKLLQDCKGNKLRQAFEEQGKRKRLENCEGIVS